MGRPAIMDLTPRQKAALHAIRDYRATHDHGPSYATIADRLGLKQPSSAYQLFCALARKGYVTRTDQPGSINLLESKP